MKFGMQIHFNAMIKDLLLVMYTSELCTSTRAQFTELKKFEKYKINAKQHQKHALH